MSTQPVPRMFETHEHNQQITTLIQREQSRLKKFIRGQIASPNEVEDLLQDVLEEFVEAYRMPEPIEQIGAWLRRVAKNRIIDRFRRRREEPLPEAPFDDDAYSLGAVLPVVEGPEGVLMRAQLLRLLQRHLLALPEEQRIVFVAHELEGRSFKELSEELGVSVNTLLSRKRYAVLFLRGQLQAVYDGQLFE